MEAVSQCRRATLGAVVLPPTGKTHALTASGMPTRVLIGSTVKVKAYEHCGVIIRANVHSAAWRRIWWINDQRMYPAYPWGPIRFRSLRAAVIAISRAIGSAA